MAAIRREIKEVEAQLELAEAEFGKVNERLRVVQQDRNNVEEELVTQNMRLKQMLDELEVRKEDASREASQVVVSSKVTMAELDRKVDAALLDVLEAKFRDEAFATAIIEQSAASSGDKVRVEFEGDEVFWTLQARQPHHRPPPPPRRAPVCSPDPWRPAASRADDGSAGTGSTPRFSTGLRPSGRRAEPA